MTLTLIARNPYTHQIGCAIASGSDDCVRGSLHIIPDKAIISVQAKSDKTTAARAVTLLQQGTACHEIIDAIRQEDPGIEMRQILIAPFDGDLHAFTGAQCLRWAGHIEHEHLIAAGNMLSSDTTLAAMEAAYMKDLRKPMQERLFAALQAGITTGGDVRGHKSAGIIIIGEHPCDWRAVNTDNPLADLVAASAA